jgi:hypothetical protein
MASPDYTLFDGRICHKLPSSGQWRFFDAGGAKNLAARGVFNVRAPNLRMKRTVAERRMRRNGEG